MGRRKLMGRYYVLIFRENYLIEQSLPLLIGAFSH